MTTDSDLSKKLASIDTKLKNARNRLKDILEEDMPSLEPWLLLREYLGKTTSQSVISSAALMGAPAENLEQMSKYAKFAPLAEIAKLPANLRLELATMLENCVDELISLIPNSEDEMMRNNIERHIQQGAKPILDKLQNQLTEFADRNKKITAIGTITTTIAAVGGFLAGAILASFAPLALAAAAGHYMKQKEKNIAKAIGAGIVGCLAGILLIPFVPLLGAALPIINNTAIFNFQLKKIKDFAQVIKKKLDDDRIAAPESPRHR